MFSRRTLQSSFSTAKVIAYAILVAWTIVCVFPLYWVAITSLKSGDDIMHGPTYVPFGDFYPTLESWRFILFDAADNLVHRYLNSVFVSCVATVLTIILSLMLLYGLTRRMKQANNPTSRLLLFSILTTRILPPIVAVLPLYLMANLLGTLDSLLMLVLVYAAVNLPVALWLLIPILKHKATEQEEAAALEGASSFTLLFGILLPMVWGQVCAVAFLVWLLCWNEYLFAAYLTSDHALTLPPFLVGQMSMKEAQIAGEAEEWAQFSAASFLMMAPLLLGAGWLQRQLRRNLLSNGPPSTCQ